MSDVAALSTLLAVEHAAVYGCAAAGGALAAAGPGAVPLLGLASAGYDAHRERRDRLVGEIRARYAVPPAGEPAYLVAVQPGDTRSALRLLADVEDRCAAAAHDALAVLADAPMKYLAAGALADAAVRAVRARRAAGYPPAVASVPFPGG